jgi:hypothetical protein
MYMIIARSKVREEVKGQERGLDGRRIARKKFREGEDRESQREGWSERVQCTNAIPASREGTEDVSAR